MAGVEHDLKAALSLVTGIQYGLINRQTMHERWIIGLQAWTWTNWPKAPPLSPLSLIARKGQAPLLDKGTLRQTIGGVVPTMIKNSPLSFNQAFPEYGLFGSKLVQAALLNFGGTVKPVRAKNLAIPLTPEAKKTGSPRGFSRKLFFVPGKALGSSQSTTGFLAESYGKNKLRMQYILKRSVIIPPRKFMPTIEEAVEVGDKVLGHYLNELASGQPQQGKP